MEEKGDSDHPSSSFSKPHIAIRCARAALVLAALRSPPLRRGSAAVAEEEQESERIRVSVSDLTAQMAAERRQLLRFGHDEVILHLVLLVLILLLLVLELMLMN